ncbi:hypothetical protein ACFQY4_30035 [Catellatospora bangladeshensis]|uniref:Lipoprotein n=1 Tax=Catellatospora bangladeshensis TaxID=310355 RepID=A0A8J3JAR7_9ACTN|nr:hypothetical protein [Catellatospora bangladeshensis]GIF80766.1 hypothetical protein Cba03nite_21150 [Catellatospora bangladeshensis]
MRRTPRLILIAACVLAAGTACGGKGGDPVTAPPTFSSVMSPSAAPATSAAPSPARTSARPSPAAPSWPSPADCVSYNPNNLTVHYEAGIHEVRDGSKVVARLHGGPGEQIGEQGLALAQRYKRHCFIGRGNGREDENAYVFDYWRDSSGKRTTIPGEDEACSSYDRGNLQVNDMGSGHGWRVKDDDHVLHVFDDESDARDGRLVLAKYGKICSLGSPPDDDQDYVTYGK